MLNSSEDLKISKLSNSIFIAIIVIFTTLSFFLFNWNKISLGFLFLLAPLFAILIVNFHKIQFPSLLFSLFLNPYINWDYRIQILNILTFILFFYFIFNYKSSIYNNYNIPKEVKLSAVLLIISLTLSAILTQHSKIKSIYFISIFYTLILSAYLFFKSIKNSSEVRNYLILFIYFLGFAAVTILVQIIATSYMRSTGIAGFPIMDISATVFLIILIRFVILEKPNILIISIGIINLIVLITLQSRFAWLGFALSFVYTLLIIFISQKEKRDKLKSKINIFITILVLLFGILFATGLNKVIVSRFSDVSVELFQGNTEKENVEFASNSLETRLMIWLTAYKTFESNPLFGVGYQMFPLVSENYNVLPSLLYEQYVENLDAHSTTMNILCEGGILGLFTYYLFIITIFVISYKAIKLSKSEIDIANSIILNGVVFFIIINGIYSGAYTIAQNAFQAYIFFGIVVGNYVIVKDKQIFGGENDKYTR